MRVSTGTVLAGLLLAGPVLVAGQSAEPSVGPPAGSGPLYIRVANASSLAMQEITIRFPFQQVDYGALAPGAISGYSEVDHAYRYASATVMTDEQTFRVLAVDYFGEMPLVPGAYTYVLNLLGPTLSFGLLVDEMPACTDAQPCNPEVMRPE